MAAGEFSDFLFLISHSYHHDSGSFHSIISRKGTQANKFQELQRQESKV